MAALVGTWAFAAWVVYRDLGQVMGKHEQTIHAIRAILIGVVAKEGKRVTLELIE